MAATTAFFTTGCPVNYGRSGYNKSVPSEERSIDRTFRLTSRRGDNEDGGEENKFVNYGRSGYNK
jgi:hypothetical protein